MNTKLAMTLAILLGGGGSHAILNAQGCGDPQVCPAYDPWPYFSHDTFGYANNLPLNAQGPSNPCQVMKAVTEGAFDTTTYNGVRISGGDFFPGAGLAHLCDVTVEYEYVSTNSENYASEGVGLDYTSWHRNCLNNLVPNLNDEFVIPGPDATLGCTNTCATYTGAVLVLNDDTIPWEPPELVRMKMIGASTATPGAVAQVPTQENYIGSWIIQDTCESGALFQYPNPLPTTGTSPGYTVQVAATVPNGNLFRYFTGVTHRAHVQQNYPYAASEVVTEGSWLEFFFVVMDTDAVTMRGANPEYSLGGTLTPAPEDVMVRFEFLNEDDWTFQSCAQPANWGSSYPHYATQGALGNFEIDSRSNDPMVYDRNDANTGWTVVNPDPVTGKTTVTIPAGETHVALRFRARDALFDTETTKIAHLNVETVWYSGATPPGHQILQLGWSKAFRFLIQENSKCPE